MSEIDPMYMWNQAVEPVEFPFNNDLTILVRYYLPIGFYPKFPFKSRDCILYIGEDVIFSAVRPTYSANSEYFSEREWVSPLELRLMASYVLSVPHGCGKVILYPCYDAFKIRDEGQDLENDDFIKYAKDKLVEWIEERCAGSEKGSLLSDSTGSQDYRFNKNAVESDRQLDIYNSIDINDDLMMRGLGALVKADLIQKHYIFNTEACVSLYIALDASFNIILNRLKPNIPNPSSADASRYICGAFESKVIPDKYFEAYYEDRIKTIHPASRYGVFYDPPLMADDYYDLFDQLVSVYDFLLTGNVSEAYRGR